MTWQDVSQALSLVAPHEKVEVKIFRTVDHRRTDFLRCILGGRMFVQCTLEQ